MSAVRAHQEFVDAVRAGLDDLASGAGLPFNGVYPSIGTEGESTSILYEGTTEEFSTRFPELVPTWDPEWNQPGHCVDLWITIRHSDDAITVRLEVWDLVDLAAWYAGDESIEACRRALSQPGDLTVRIDAIAEVLECALEAAGAVLPQERSDVGGGVTEGDGGGSFP